MKKEARVAIFVISILLGGILYASVQTETLTSSSEVGITPKEAARLLPFPPSQLTVKTIERGIIVEWRGTGEDITQYNIYRKTSPEEWHLLGSVQPAGDNRGGYEFTDPTPEPDTTYTYGVAAVNIYGKKEGPISKSAPITQRSNL